LYKFCIGGLDKHLLGVVATFPLLLHSLMCAGKTSERYFFNVIAQAEIRF